MEYEIDQMVYLSTANLNMEQKTPKLTPRFIGPFKIIETVDKNVFKLELPPTWKIKNSFHVSKLKQAYLNDDEKFPLRKQENAP